MTGVQTCALPIWLPPDALRRVMTADAAKLPAFAGAVRGADGFVIYRVNRVVAGTAKPEDLKQEAAQLNQQAGGEQLDAYIASLRGRAKIVLVKENLEKPN